MGRVGNESYTSNAGRSCDDNLCRRPMDYSDGEQQMTDTPNMRERLARALHDAMPGLGDGDELPSWCERVAVVKGLYLEAVDALLSELERPSKEMIQASGDVSIMAGTYGIDAEDAVAVFAAMVKAIRGGA